MSKRPSRNAQRKMWSTCAFQRACHQTLCDGGSLKMVHRKSATTAMFIHQVCDVCHRFCTDVPCVDHKQAGYLHHVCLEQMHSRPVISHLALRCGNSQSGPDREIKPSLLLFYVFKQKMSVGCQTLSGTLMLIACLTKQFTCSRLKLYMSPHRRNTIEKS